MASLGRIRTVWTNVAGSPYYTNQWFLTDGTGTGMQSSCDAWTDYLNAVVDNMNGAMVCTVEADVPIIDSTTGTLTGNTTIAPEAVSLGGSADILPPTVQGLIRWKTGLVVAGRRLRGRTFLPGFLESLNQSNGTPSGTLVAAVNALTSTYISGTGAAPLVVYGPTHHAFSEVDSGDMWTQWASLRSRRD